jgi:putative membrane protein
MLRILVRWAINAIAIWAAIKLVPGIHHGGTGATLLLIALIFGLINALIRPLICVLSCPLLVLTLGLFTLVINTLMLQLTAWITGPILTINGFWPAFWGAVIISIVSGLLNVLIKDERESDRRPRRAS